MKDIDYLIERNNLIIENYRNRHKAESKLLFDYLEIDMVQL